MKKIIVTMGLIGIMGTGTAFATRMGIGVGTKKSLTAFKEKRKHLESRYELGDCTITQEEIIIKHLVKELDGSDTYQAVMEIKIVDHRRGTHDEITLHGESIDLLVEGSKISEKYKNKKHVSKGDMSTELFSFKTWKRVTKFDPVNSQLSYFFSREPGYKVKCSK